MSMCMATAFTDWLVKYSCFPFPCRLHLGSTDWCTCPSLIYLIGWDSSHAAGTKFLKWSSSTDAQNEVRIISSSSCLPSTSIWFSYSSASCKRLNSQKWPVGSPLNLGAPTQLTTASLTVPSFPRILIKLFFKPVSAKLWAISSYCGYSLFPSSLLPVLALNHQEEVVMIWRASPVCNSLAKGQYLKSPVKKIVVVVEWAKNEIAKIILLYRKGENSKR